MYTIQLSYYSLISINAFCPPFDGLAGLKYSRGFNPFFQDLQQAYIASNYVSLDIRSNFLSNVNLMLLPLYLLPLCYFPLKYIGDISQNYIAKPRCSKYSKSFLCEVPLTILLFNSFNICTSFVVGIQAFKWSNFSSLFVSMIMFSLLPIAAGLFFKFRKHFSEFREEFDAVDRLFNLPVKRSAFIRRLYLFVLMLEMTLVPTLLAIESIFKTSLYAVLVV